MDFDRYVEKSDFLAEINNERPDKNASYAENLAKLENFVLVKFTQVSGSPTNIWSRLRNELIPSSLRTTSLGPFQL